MKQVKTGHLTKEDAIFKLRVGDVNKELKKDASASFLALRQAIFFSRRILKSASM